jgi:predicted ATPase
LVPDLVQRLPDLGEPTSVDPDSERFQLFEAIADWLAVAGGDGASLLVLDDVHWADAGSLHVLRHLIDRAPGGVLVVGTYRDTDVARGHPLASVLADLRRLPSVTRLAIAGLDAQEVRDLVEQAGGNELDETGEGFARLVADESAGNPFFVGELLRHLVESGVLVQRDGRWTSDLTVDQLGIPEGIREVVGRRLSRLGDDTDEVLRAAAVIGYEFDLDLVAAVTARTPDATLDALEAAVAAGLVIEVGVDRFRFAHALVRQTLHEELSSSRRARAHRRVAEALEQLHADRLDDVLPLLALHWAEAAGGGDPSVAVDYGERAGDHALDRLAYEEAAEHYRRALELLDDADGEQAVRPRLLTRLAQAQSYAADPTTSSPSASRRPPPSMRESSTPPSTPWRSPTGPR